MVNGSYDNRESQRFVEFITNDGAINAGAVCVAFEDADGVGKKLEAFRAIYGDNFNTLIVLNTSAVNVNVLLDGKTITTVNGNNGSFSFDWQDKILFNTLAFKNIDGAVAVGDNALRITLGRTGV
jgi:hypothetical protein